MIGEKERTIRAALIDLDGTLIDLDWRRNMRGYHKQIKKLLPNMGSKVAYLYSVRWAANRTMKDESGKIMNIDRYFKYLNEKTDLPDEKNRELYFKFYREFFPGFRGSVKQLEGAHKLIQTCKKVGLKIVLATNPLFPLSAVEERLRWGEIDPALFDLITHAQNSYYCKPSKKYFIEVAEKIGVNPSDCLMIGDDFKMDIRPANSLNMATWWVLNKKKKKRKGVLSGRITDLEMEIRKTIHV